MEILCDKCSKSVDLTNLAGRIECPNCLNEIKFELSSEEKEKILKETPDFGNLHDITLPGMEESDIFSKQEMERIAVEFFKIDEPGESKESILDENSSQIVQNATEEIKADKTSIDESAWIFKPTDGSPTIEEILINRETVEDEAIVAFDEMVHPKTDLGDDTFLVSEKGALDENLLSEEPLTEESKEFVGHTEGVPEAGILTPDEEEKRKIVDQFLEKLKKPTDYLVAKKGGGEKKKRFVIFETKYLILFAIVILLNIGVMTYFLVFRDSGKDDKSLSSKERKLFQSDLKKIESLLIEGDYEISIKEAVKIASFWYEKAPAYELVTALYYESKFFLYNAAQSGEKEIGAEIEGYLGGIPNEASQNPLIQRLKGFFAYSNGHFEEADNHFKEALKIFPTDVLLYTYLILCRIRTQKYDAANEALLTLKKISDKSYLIPYLNGLILLGNSKYEESLNEFNEAIKLNDKNIEVYYAKVDAILHISREEATQYLKETQNHYSKYASKEQIAVSFLKLGEIAKESGNYNTYMEYLAKGIKYVPYCPLYPFLLGDVHFDMQNFNEAANYYRIAYKLDDTGSKYVLGRARSEYLNKRYVEGLVLLDKLTVESGYSGAVFYTSALIQNALKSEEKVLYNLKNSIAKDPNYVQSYIELAHYELSKGNKGEAEGYLKKAVEVNPRSYLAHYGYARFLTQNQDLDAAESELLKSIELNSDFALSYNLLGRTYYLRGKHDEGLSYYNKALALSSDNSEILVNLGIYYKDAGKYDNAREQFDKILDKIPEHPLATRYRGETDVDEGLKQNRETTLLFLQKAAKFDLKDPMTHYNLGRYYEMINDFDAALIHYKRARLVDQNDSNITLTVARIYYILKEIPQGIYYANEAIKLDSANGKALHLLGRIALQQGEYEDAIGYFQRELVLDNFNSEANIGLGDAYKNIGKDEDAVKNYRRAIAILSNERDAQPNSSMRQDVLNYTRKKEYLGDKGSNQKTNDPVTNRKICETHIKIGQHYDNNLILSKSVKEYKRAKELCPDFPDAYKQLGLAFKDMKRYSEALDELNHYLSLEKEPDAGDKTIPKEDIEFKIKEREEVRDEIVNIESKL